MRKRVVLIAIGVAGLLVVLSLLAFSAYAVHIAAAASSVNVMSRPAQLDTSATTDESTLIDMSSNASGQVNLSPHHIGRECDASATDNADNVGY